MKLYIYSVTCCLLPAIHKYKRYIVLFCVNETNESITLVIDPTTWKPFILVSVDGPDAPTARDTAIVQDALEQVDDAVSFGKGGLTAEPVMMTPLLGFTNNRKDVLWRLRFDDPAYHNRIIKHLTEHGIGPKIDPSSAGLEAVADSNDTTYRPKDVTVRHEQMKPVDQFLFTSGLRIASWIEVTAGLRPMHSATTSSSQCFMIGAGNINALETPPMPVPPLTLAYIRVDALSSSATRTNLFGADPTRAEDVLQCIAVTVTRLDKPKDKPIEHVLLASEYKDERSLLVGFRELISSANPHVLCECTDVRDDIRYLHRRALVYGKDDVRRNWTQRLPMDLGLSTIDGHFPREIVYEGRELDVTHLGRERFDLRAVLKKYMVSPPLDGCTLIDALAHPKLVRTKSDVLLPDETVVNPLSHVNDKVLRMKQEVAVMIAVIVDNNLIPGQLALCTACDLPLFKICERGQGTRTRNTFFRAHMAENLYWNIEQLETNFVVVKRAKKDTMYADPPFIKNPSLADLVLPPSSSSSSSVLGKRDRVPATKTFTSTTTNNKKQKRKKKKKNKKKRQSLFDLFGSDVTISNHDVIAATIAAAAKESDRRFVGGAVFEPEAGHYTDPRHAITTIDWGSLYPSSIVSERICYMRVVYDKKWLDDPDCVIAYVPLDDHYAVPIVVSYKGEHPRTITDVITADVMQCRAKAKKAMKAAPDDFTRAACDALQLSYKIVQNSLYGFLGAVTSGLCCIALSVWTTQCGQWLNKHARYTAIAEYFCRCVYGDTDSIMLQWPLLSDLVDRDAVLSAIHAKAVAFGKAITARSRKPQIDEFESLKIPSLFTRKKKTYAAIEYDDKFNAWNGHGHLLEKGLAFKKRDRCSAVNVMGSAMLKKTLMGASPDELVTLFDTHITGFNPTPATKDDLMPYVLTVELNTEYKCENSLALDLASQLQRDTGARPAPGTRIKYVVQYHTDGRQHYCCGRPLLSFLGDPTARLSHSYYLAKQFLLPTKQILDLQPTTYRRLQAVVHRRIEVLENIAIGQRTL
jgi:DNA polymerase elongation subunit (family B)